MSDRHRSNPIVQGLEPRRLLAGTAQLFADLTEAGLNPGSFFNFGTKVVFAGDSPTQGRELYITDGTTAGTHLIADISPGSNGSTPSPVFDSGKYLYFTANGGYQREGLWKTDGTAKGTTLVEELDNSGPYNSHFGEFTAIAPDKVLFAIVSEDAVPPGGSLFCDTPSGVNLVHGEFEGDWMPLDTEVVSSRGYAVGATPSGLAIYQTDGTFDGTQQITFRSTSISALTSYGNQLYLIARARIGKGAWHAGLWKIKSNNKPVFLMPADDLDILPQNAASSAFWFVSNDDAGTTKLWRLDSTGISAVSTIAGGAGLTSYSPISVTPSGIFFAPVTPLNSYATNANDLWYCGNAAPAAVKIGSLSSARAINPTSPSIERLTASGNTAFVEVDQNDGNNTHASLWRGTSTSGSLKMFAPMALADDRWGTERDATPSSFDIAAGSSQLVFSSPDSTNQAELWSLSTVGAGAKQLTETLGGAGSSGVANLTPFKSGFVFDSETSIGAGQGWYPYAHSIWYEDGVSPPKLIKRLIRHDGSSDSDYDLTGPSNSTFFSAGSYVLFSQSDGPDPEHAGYELWRTDGTPAGTYRFRSGITAPTFIGQIASKVLFAVYDYTDEMHSGYTLWVTDGTTAGTKSLKTVANVYGAPTDGPTNAVVFDGKLYFGLSGALFISDGTAAGTINVSSQLQPSSTPNTPLFVEWLALRSGKLLIAGDSGADGFAQQATVWSLSPGATSAPRLMQALAAQKFYALHAIAETGRAWVETVDNFEFTHTFYSVPTSPAKVPPQPGFHAPGTLQNILGFAGGNYYVQTQDDDGATHLYALDPALGNPRLVTGFDANQGVVDSLYNFGNALFAVQRSMDSGQVIRLSATTLAHLADDDPDATEPYGAPFPLFTPIGQRLFFIGADPLHGSELWSYA